MVWLLSTSTTWKPKVLIQALLSTGQQAPSTMHACFLIPTVSAMSDLHFLSEH